MDKKYHKWEVATLDVWGNGGTASAVAVDEDEAVIGPDGDGTEAGWRVDTDGADGMLPETYDTQEEAEKAAERYNDGEHWNVNNVFRHDDEVTIAEDATNTEILTYLMQNGPLNADYCKDRTLSIDGDDGFLVIEDNTDDADGRGKPVLYLYKNDYENITADEEG